MKRKIGIIGLGHVGLPTALGFAELGWNVVGADDDAAKAQAIAAGLMPFYEPSLDPLLRKHLAEDRFTVAGSVQEAMKAAEILFVCVGTPQREDGSADMSQIEAVSRNIAHCLNGYKLIVEKSTSPVRTAGQIKRTIQRYGNGNHHQFDVAVNPEFLREGKAWTDFLNPERIVLGVDAERARALLLEIFDPLLGRVPSCKVVITDVSTAELIKHASNAFLATKISFINMMADFCEAVGADVTMVACGMGMDPRISPAFLQAGAGFGGYCLPKDLRALIHMGEENGVDVALLHAVEQVNKQRVDHLIRKLERAVWVLGGKTVGVLGVAFKPETDDIREAPSVKVIERLLAQGVRVQVHDPQALDYVQARFGENPGRLACNESAYDAARGAHALLLLTEWDEYRDLDPRRLAALMETPIMVDGRNFFDPKVFRDAGFEYASIGRP